MSFHEEWALVSLCGRLTLPREDCNRIDPPSSTSKTHSPEDFSCIIYSTSGSSASAFGAFFVCRKLAQFAGVRLSVSSCIWNLVLRLHFDASIQWYVFYTDVPMNWDVCCHKMAQCWGYPPVNLEANSIVWDLILVTRTTYAFVSPVDLGLKTKAVWYWCGDLDMLSRVTPKPIPTYLLVFLVPLVLPAHWDGQFHGEGWETVLHQGGQPMFM